MLMFLFIVLVLAFVLAAVLALLCYVILYKLDLGVAYATDKLFHKDLLDSQRSRLLIYKIISAMVGVSLAAMAVGSFGS